jgi:hypothetical protein
MALKSYMSRDQFPTPRRCCGTMSYHYGQLERTPGFRQVLGAVEQATNRMMARLDTFGVPSPITVPVVVHVLYNMSKEKISDKQIQSQIDVLNADFSAMNADGNLIPDVWKNLRMDAGIRFQLAKIDPKGKKTTGIVRRKTTKKVFGSNDAMKFRSLGGADAWPSDTYLNIWVCTLGEGLLGYAQFPGGPPETDGVVILNAAFGTNGVVQAPFNLGRTATHEVGHWLNLRHIWGDTQDCSGSDFVSDTPTQQFPNRDKPTFPKVSCGNGPNGDMFMNFMDYVDDAAMQMFTKGQVVRMHAALQAARPGFRAAAAVPTG